MTAAAPGAEDVLAVEPRGVTTVAPRAVRRIAAHAATEVPGVGAPVRVEAHVRGDHTRLAAEIPVRYPEPVRHTTDACRAHLVARVGELTGLRVARVEIVVPRLTTEPRPAGRAVS